MDFLLSVLSWFDSWLGFTTWTWIDTVLNIAAYAAFYFIIRAVHKERFINETFAVCGGFLGIYAWFFLGNLLLATLQGLIFVSASLQFAEVKRRSGIMIMSVLTIAAYVWLASSGMLTDTKAIIGSIGLLGIAIGIMLLPSRHAFLMMAVGGVLLVYYSFPAAMVFVLLNIFFTYVNIQKWREARKAVVTKSSQ